MQHRGNRVIGRAPTRPPASKRVLGVSTDVEESGILYADKPRGDGHDGIRRHTPSMAQRTEVPRLNMRLTIALPRADAHEERVSGRPGSPISHEESG